MLAAKTKIMTIDRLKSFQRLPLTKGTKYSPIIIVQLHPLKLSQYMHELRYTLFCMHAITMCMHTYISVSRPLRHVFTKLFADTTVRCKKCFSAMNVFVVTVSDALACMDSL
jgi:hypothetical protein